MNTLAFFMTTTKQSPQHGATTIKTLTFMGGLAVLIGALCENPAQAKSKTKDSDFSEIPGLTEPRASALSQVTLPTATGEPATATRPLPAPVAQLTNPSATPEPATPVSPPSSSVSRLAPAAAAPPDGTPAPRSTAVPEAAQGKFLYSFQANDLDLKAALASFARANNLNIVPDNDISGTVTLDVRELPLEQMMRALLDASDCAWERDGSLIRIHSTETRIFNVDYLRMTRTGRGQTAATLNTATYAGATGSGGSGGGSGGGGGGGVAGGTTGANPGGSSVNVLADNPVEFWKDLKTELASMLSESGRSSLAINMIAGIIQVTDRPSVLRRVDNYLRGVDQSIHRQVDLEARVYDVLLNNQFQFGIDWVHVAEAAGGAVGFGTATFPVPIGSTTAAGNSTVAGLNRFGEAPGSANPFAMIFTNFNSQAAVNALKQQGTVEVISKPRIRTLNNQTALIKVGSEQPFFTQTTQNNQSQSGNVTFESAQVTTVTIGTVLSITPQIAANDWISLDISPVLTSLEGVSFFGGTTLANSTASAPILDTKQAASLLRVRDGATIVMGGLIQTENAKNDTKVPLLGDIPGLGKLFTGTFRFKQKKELVIFVTPHIVRDDQERPLPPIPAVEPKFDHQ